MKKNILIISTIFFVIMCSLFIFLRNIQAKERALKKENSQYEVYLNQEIYGTDLATLINKIVNHNEKNNVQKNENGYYIEDENSIILQVNMKTVEKTYKMEQFYNNDITMFVKNFNQIEFRCTDINYKQNGKINSLTFEEIQEEIKV